MAEGVLALGLFPPYLWFNVVDAFFLSFFLEEFESRLWLFYPRF